MDQSVKSFFQKFIEDSDNPASLGNSQVIYYNSWARKLMGMSTKDIPSGKSGTIVVLEDPDKRRTELEYHLIDYCREDDIVSINDWDQSSHILQEFVDGYERKHEGKSTYVTTEEDQVIMDAFLKIAKADIEGNYEYKAEDFQKITTALDRFGL